MVAGNGCHLPMASPAVAFALLVNMNTNMSPLAWFSKWTDAERVCGALQRLGISATVRESRNPPPGWETRQTHGFDLWVIEPEFAAALAAYQQMIRPAPPESSGPNTPRPRATRAAVQRRSSPRAKNGHALPKRLAELVAANRR